MYTKLIENRLKKGSKETNKLSKEVDEILSTNEDYSSLEEPMNHVKLLQKQLEKHTKIWKKIQNMDNTHKTVCCVLFWNLLCNTDKLNSEIIELYIKNIENPSEIDYEMILWKMRGINEAEEYLLNMPDKNSDTIENKSSLSQKLLDFYPDE